MLRGGAAVAGWRPDRPVVGDGARRTHVREVGGRVVVVTGGASGIGFALARSFAGDGARLVVADIDERALTLAAEQLATTGADVVAVATDVSEPDSVEELAAAAVERFGAVHVVCNNAGALAMGPAWDVSLDDWRRIIGVNLLGVVHGIRSFVPRMLDSGDVGYVINTASMAGVKSLPTLGPYVASKHAVVGLSEVLAHDLEAVGAADRIGVSVLCPGYVPTRLGAVDRSAPVPDAKPGQPNAGDVAAAVRAAMAERRFYVFSHPGSTDIVAARSAAIVDGRRPHGVAVPDPG